MGELRTGGRRRVAAAVIGALFAGLAGLSVTAPAQAATAPTITPAPASADGVAMLNWWRAQGARWDGAAMSAVVHDSSLDTGPQNHAAYLARIRDQGSSYCGHGSDVAPWTRPTVDASGVPIDYTHNVLQCGGDSVDAAMVSWNTTPFHAGPLLNPATTAVGTGFATSSTVAFSTGRVKTPAAPTGTYYWPGNGKVMPRTAFPGNESPDPTGTCGKPGGSFGAPAHIWYPTAQTFVSASLKDESGATVGLCVLTETNATPVSGTTAVGHYILFPDAPLTAGTNYTASVTTTTKTDTWTFFAANTPDAPSSTATAGKLTVSGSVTAPTNTGGYPVTGYELIGKRAMSGGVDWSRPVSAGSYSVTVPAGSWYVCARARNALGSSGCSGYWPLTVTKQPLQVTPTSVLRQTGTSNPVFTTTLTGWAAGQSASNSDVTGAPVCTSTATTSSPAGSYPITCTQGTLASSDYSFDLVPGTVVVTDAPVSTTGAAQTVTLGDPGAQVYGAVFDVTGTSSASLPVTLSSTTPSVCTISGTTVTTVGAGTCAIFGYQPGNGTFKAASTTRTVVVAKAPLTARPFDATRAPGDAQPAFTTTYSGFVRGETLQTAGITGQAGCESDTSTTPGTYSILCWNPGDFTSANYRLSGSTGYGTMLVANGLTRTTATGTSSQSLTGTLPQPGQGQSAQLTHTATSGLPVTFATLTPATCTVSGSKVTAVATGTCTVGIVQAGNSTWAPTVRTASYTVGPPKTTQSITFTPPASSTYGSALSLTGTASSGLILTYSSATPAVCTVSGNTTTLVGVGTCTLTASQAGNAAYAPASATASITVAKKALTVTAVSGSRPQGAANPALTTTITGFVLGQSLATSGVTGTATCTTTATTASPVGDYPITCTTGTLAAANYSFTFAPGTLTVTAATGQTVTTPALSAVTTGYGTSVTATAAASSGLPVTYAVTGPCTVSGTTITPTAAGTCTVTATQAGGGGWAPATSPPATLTVTKATITVTADNATRGYGQANPTFTTTMTGFVNGETRATSGITGAPACTSTATATNTPGVYPITCTTGTLASTKYAFTFTPGTLTVTQAGQTITFPAIPAGTYGDQTTLAATASSGLSVSYASTTPAVCTVSGTTLTMTGVGTCTVTATQAGDARYTAAASVTRSATVGKRTVTVTADNQTQQLGQATPALTATWSGFALGQTLTSSGVTGNPSCTTTATAASPLGTYPITCTTGTLASATYAFSFAGGTVTVTDLPPQPQAVTFTSVPTPAYGDTAPVTATATSGLPVTFTTTGSCTVTGSTLTATAAGPCTITATQAGGPGWQPASTQTTVTAGKRQLTIIPVNTGRDTGQPNPALTATLTGFVAGDTPATTVTGAVVCTTSATPASPAGTYPIVCTTGTLTATNYTFTPGAPGTLTVTSQYAPFVKHAYVNFLGRQPTAAELADTTTRLDNGTLTKVDFLNQMARSDEWVTVIVTKLYADTLNRAPDPTGQTYWNTQIATGRLTVAWTAAGFYSSEEYYTNAGGTDAAWITDLYTKILGRTPSQADTDFWVARTRESGRTNIAYAIYQSYESRYKRSNDLYLRLLHRPMEPTGAAYWPDYLARGEDITLAIILGASDEFRLHAQAAYPNP